MSRQTGSGLRSSKSRGGSSKYDFVKVRVWLGEAPSIHYYVLSRYLICRMLTVTGVTNVKAAKVALQVKKYLVDHDMFDVSQTELENSLFDIMRQHGYDDSYVQRYRMVAAFFQSRTPIVLLLCGAPCVGKSTIARLLAERLNLPNVQQTSVISELLLADDDRHDDNSQNDLLFGSFPDSNNTEEEESLIQEFRNQCMKIRGGIQGDLTKAFKDRKSLIVEGLHLDPGLYLSEFGIDGIRDVSVPEKVVKQQEKQRTSVENTETPFDVHKSVPEFVVETDRLERIQSSPIMIRSQTTPDFVKSLNRQYDADNFQDAMFLLRKPSPDSRGNTSGTIPSPKMLRQLSRREAERSLRSAYVTIRKSNRRVFASNSLRTILTHGQQYASIESQFSVPISRKKSFSDGEQQQLVSPHTAPPSTSMQTGKGFKNMQNKEILLEDHAKQDKNEDVARWITTTTTTSNLKQDSNSNSNFDVSNDQNLVEPEFLIQMPHRATQQQHQKQSYSGRKASFERCVLPSRLRQTTFEEEQPDLVVQNSLEKNQIEDNNYLADADSSAGNSVKDDKDSDSGDEVVPTKQISIESKNLSNQQINDSNLSSIDSFKDGGQSKRNLFEPKPPKSKQVLKNSYNEKQPKNDSKQKSAFEQPDNNNDDGFDQSRNNSNYNQAQLGKQQESNVKNQQGGGEQYPLFVPIVLSMPLNDHRGLAEEWFARQKEIKHENKEQWRNVEGEFDKIFRRMRVLQEYLEAYKNHGVPVVRISIGHFRDTLDRLHEYLLQCIEMNVSRQGLQV